MQSRLALLFLLLVLCLSTSVATAQANLDQKTLIRMLLTVDEVRQVLHDEGWKLKAPAEPLLREPEGTLLTAAVIFNRDSTLLLIVLYVFATADGAQKFYTDPLQGGEQDELSTEVASLLKVGKDDGPDQAKVILDKGENQKLLLFRKGQIVALFRSTSSDFADEDFIKLSVKQLEIIRKGRN